MNTIEVHSKIIGTSSELPTVDLEILGEATTVSDLIRQTVSAQIRSLASDGQLAQPSIARALQRHYLPEAELREQATQEKVGLPAKAQMPYTVNVQREIARALDAFRKNTFLILVDGKQAEQLDDPIVLTAASKVFFVRLTPLVGG